MRLSVLVVEDGSSAIDLTRRLVHADKRTFNVVTYTATELMQCVRSYFVPDVLFIDNSMFRITHEAKRLLAHIKGCWPKARLLAFGNGRLQDILAAAQGGAAGYVHHTASTEEIVDVICRVITADEFILTSSIMMAFDASTVLSPLYIEASRSLSTLSPRERDVILLAASGMSNLELGEFLHLSENTAKWHVNNALRKLGLRNRSQLAAWFRGRIQPVTINNIPNTAPSDC